ncbi:hypothetical protein B0H10DRAFT_1954095 [Mycena sp. CBHHK59/15]|nr:hypothetical protein B0H10DRAFT_1954095 [Mycena sp. CBHHK59/15]
MWLPTSLLTLLAATLLPAVASAQSVRPFFLIFSPSYSSQSSGSTTAPASNTSGSPSNSVQVTVITSLSTGVVLGSNRQQIATTATFITTSTIAPTTPTVSAATSTSASATTTANLPTGTATVVTDQAPSPGATGGAYGPNDGYIAAASALKRHPLVLGLGTLIIGGLFVA